MAISTNGTVLARLAGALYNTQMSYATYSEVKALDPATLANTLYARDFGSATDTAVATTLVTNLGLTSVAGLTNWVAAQLTAAGNANKGSKVVDLLNGFAQMTTDTTYGAYATAFNTKVDAALLASQTTGNTGGTFAAAGVAPTPVNGTFALTTSIDAIVGGAGDDTITAAATSASTGTANTTVNSGDAIDGGAGTDTLTITATAANNNTLSGLTVTNVEKIVITGSDNLGSTTSGAATVAAGAAQVIDWAVANGAAATAATHAITAVINGVTYTTSYAGNSTLATGVANKQAAIVTLLNTVLGGTNTAAGTSPEITLTSKAKGSAIPTITITETANGASTTTAAVTADTTSDTKTVANALKTDAAAVKEVVTITTTDGSTAGFNTNNTFTLYIDGVSYGSPVLATTSTVSDVISSLASTVNSVLGAGTAVAVAGTLTITAPVAGTPLPSISVSAGGTDPGVPTVTVSRENVAVGAASTTSTSASVSATQFTGATSIAVDGNTTNVTGLTTQSVTLSGTALANTLKFSAGATSANIVLSAAAGTVTLDDNSTSTATTTVTTANVTGTVKGSTASSHTQSVPGSITINETLGTSDGDTIKTLSLGLTSNATVVTTGMTKLISFDASTSTGGVTATLNAASNQLALNSAKGGSGNDALTVTFATDINGSTNTATASFSGGAGNDTMTISGVGTGTLAVDGGTGNDTIVVGTTLLNTSLAINGGDGTDKIKFTAGSTTLTAGEFALLASQVTNVERAEFVTATSLDASKVAQFTIIDLGADTATVTKLADAQTVNAAISATLTANGYVGVGSTAGNAAGLTATAYAGNLTVNASGSSKTETINANAATVNVSNISSTTSGSVGDQTASSVTITGDVKTLTVNLAGGNDYVLIPTTNDVLSTVTITPAATLVGASGTAYAALGALTSVTLVGAGSAVIDNSANASSAASTKLVTIDASQMGAVKGALAGTAAGNPLAGLTYTGNTYLAETVILGKGLDTLTLNSTYDKMDTITGFTLVGNSDASLNTDKSDALFSTVTAVKMTTGLTGTTLGAVLTQVAASSSSANQFVVFQWNGDTYYFGDSSSTSTTLDAADTVVKFTGLVDLDLLILALA